MRKPDFCICENKDAYQLCDNRAADQLLCFCYKDSTILLSSVAVQPGLCCPWSETPKAGFLLMRFTLYSAERLLREQ